MDHFVATKDAKHPSSEQLKRHFQPSALDRDLALEFDANLCSEDKNWQRFSCHIYNHYLADNSRSEESLSIHACPAFSTLLLNFKKAIELDINYLRINLPDYSESNSTINKDENQIAIIHEIIKQAGHLGLITIFHEKKGTALLFPSATILSFI